MLGNPVQGYIYPMGAAHPAGTFVVTATFGQVDADHPTPHQGIDIGDGKCGSPIIAVEDGTVSSAFLDPGTGAWIARYRLTRYPYLEAALAHMPSLEVAAGQVVTRGQVIGHIGTSGALACHLHGGMKRLVNGVWNEIDWWDLLDQNGAGDMIPIPGANYTRLANKKAALKAPGNFRTERKSGAILQPFGLGTVIYPVAYANDGDVPAGSQSGEWFYCFLYVTGKGEMGGWFHSSVVGPLVDDVAADCGPQVTAAVAPLNAKIAAAKTALG